MGIFEFIGDVCSAAIDCAESTARSTAEMTGNALGSAINGVEDCVDFIAENPGTASLVTGATIASAVLAETAATVIASTAGGAGMWG